MQGKGRMTENKLELSGWIEDIVAFHKAKRKFVSLKEIELEDANHFLFASLMVITFEILPTNFQKYLILRGLKRNRRI